MEKRLTTRKDFLAIGSLLATAPQVVGPATPSSNTSVAGDADLTFTFDRQVFERVLNKPAKHRQCFGAVRLDGGGIVTSMANSIMAYDDFLQEGLGAMYAVGVLYHSSAIALAMNDDVWDNILVPYLKHNLDWQKEIPEAKAGGGNPYMKPIWVPGLIKYRGGAFFVCNNAITAFAYGAAEALSRPAQEVYTEILKGIVPGAVLVPSGVMAINACQEARFTYIQTSL